MVAVIAFFQTVWLFLVHFFQAMGRYLRLPNRYVKGVEGEVVLVTGGGSGIGQLVARKLAKLGATVVVWDLDQAGAEQTARLCREDGASYRVGAHSFVCDVTRREQVYETARKVKEAVGPVTILINNAGIVSGKDLLDLPDEKIEATFKVNAISHFWTVKAFLPDMIAQNYGHIVSIASVAGKFGVARLTDYCASKFAAFGFMESLRDELFWQGHDGIHVTTVCPYFISTGMFKGADGGFLDILTPDYVSDKIISAIRNNQETLMLPRFMYFASFFKEFLPHQCFQDVYTFIVGPSMVGFEGRNHQKKL